MKNLERLKMEIKDAGFSDDELTVFLQENGLNSEGVYDADSKSNLRAILSTALSCLEALANNPMQMRTVRTDDMTISDFSDNLQNRISALEKKIRGLPTDEQLYEGEATFAYLFRK